MSGASSSAAGARERRDPAAARSPRRALPRRRRRGPRWRVARTVASTAQRSEPRPARGAAEDVDEGVGGREDAASTPAIVAATRARGPARPAGRADAGRACRTTGRPDAWTSRPGRRGRVGPDRGNGAAATRRRRSRRARRRRRRAPARRGGQDLGARATRSCGRGAPRARGRRAEDGEQPGVRAGRGRAQQQRAAARRAGRAGSRREPSGACRRPRPRMRRRRDTAARRTCVCARRGKGAQAASGRAGQRSEAVGGNGGSNASNSSMSEKVARRGGSYGARAAGAASAWRWRGKARPRIRDGRAGPRPRAPPPGARRPRRPSRRRRKTRAVACGSSAAVPPSASDLPRDRRAALQAVVTAGHDVDDDRLAVDDLRDGDLVVERVTTGHWRPPGTARPSRRRDARPENSRSAAVPALPAHPCGAVAVRHDARTYLRERRNVAGIDEDPGLPVDDDLGQPADPRGDRRGGRPARLPAPRGRSPRAATVRATACARG